MKKENYTTPEVEVLEVAIEKGFAQTGIHDEFDGEWVTP